MRTRATTPLLHRRPDWRLLASLVLAALLLGLAGVCGVSQLALRLLTPYGAVYPHSLLAMYSADYGPWDHAEAPQLPPLNPQAALAAERDLANTGGAPGIVPPAVLPVVAETIGTSVAAIQPTSTPSLVPT